MLDQIKIITARRAYEFQPDDLRLSLLSTKEALEIIQPLFFFKNATLGTPMDTFGPVPKTLPPGVVLNWGSLAYPEGRVTPIRFIHFEQQRIVIDAMGPSSVIGAIFERLQNALADLRGPEDSPAIGAPARILNWSEITAHYDFAPSALFNPALLRLLNRVFIPPERLETQMLAPMLRLTTADMDKEYSGSPTIPVYGAFSFELRKGTMPNAEIYYTSAPLDTESHLQALRELESALTSKAK